MSSSKPIGIIGAMDVEVELLKASMEDCRIEAFGKTNFVIGTISSKPCVLVQCGVGMVNAAACTQHLIDRYDVQCVINTGVAGSLQSGIGIYDLVVAQDAVNWTMDVCNLGYEIGQTPGADSPFINCDKGLISLAEQAATEIGIKAIKGRVASGDKFVREEDEKKYIAETFKASCCEMEGAAIASVCDTNQIPCAILRMISDTADGTDSIDYPTFEAEAAKRCARLTAQLIGLI